MLQASQIIDKYISFFEKKRHKRIANSPLVPQNDPTTLFTSSGMQPLVPYLLGEKHPSGKRLVNVQDSFRAADIDEVGDNRHTTFFRMLGNWSLGDYFKEEQLKWYWEFLTKEVELPKDKLYITVFKGYGNIPKDEESEKIWTEILENSGLDPKERIFSYGIESNWWSRSGGPNEMPEGEPGGPDSEVFFDFGTPHEKKFGEKCHPNCQCGRFLEIGNSVFMEYQKTKDGFRPLPNKNVDFGGGLERLLAAYENQSDIFKTSLIFPIIEALEEGTGKKYEDNKKEMRITADHLIASVFISASNVKPSNTEQGYILRRLIRRAFDNINILNDENILGTFEKIIESVVASYSKTDPELKDNYEEVKYSILEESGNYKSTITHAVEFIKKKYPNISDEIKGGTKISSDDAFILYSTHGLSPTQIKSLGFIFDDQDFSKKMEEHQNLSRKGAQKKFAGGLADHSEKTVMGHTATHLLHQALRDVLGDKVHQTGSNITPERVRFDFTYDQKLTDDEISKVEEIVNKKIEENLPVRFELMSLQKAKDLGAIGLFDEKYEDNVKVYFIGSSTGHSTVSSDRIGSGRPYSAEFCGGPHVDFTGRLKKIKILKQENIGSKQRRIYAKVHDL
jgi:alanyl-tRNA synthetase